MTDRWPDLASDGRGSAGAQLSAEAARAVEAGTEREGRRCFMCGRTFRPSYAEPVDGGEGVELCLGCGALYELPACC